MRAAGLSRVISEMDTTPTMHPPPPTPSTATTTMTCAVNGVVGNCKSSEWHCVYMRSAAARTTSFPHRKSERKTQQQDPAQIARVGRNLANRIQLCRRAPYWRERQRQRERRREIGRFNCLVHCKISERRQNFGVSLALSRYCC